jgi:hypothetical protein
VGVTLCELRSALEPEYPPILEAVPAVRGRVLAAGRGGYTLSSSSRERTCGTGRCNPLRLLCEPVSLKHITDTVAAQLRSNTSCKVHTPRAISSSKPPTSLAAPVYREVPGRVRALTGVPSSNWSSSW